MGFCDILLCLGGHCDFYVLFKIYYSQICFLHVFFNNLVLVHTCLSVFTCVNCQVLDSQKPTVQSGHVQGMFNRLVDLKILPVNVFYIQSKVVC